MVFGSTAMGGAQAFVLNVLRNIDRSKFKIDIVVNEVADKNGINDELVAYGANIYILPFFKVYNYFTYKRAWYKFLSCNRYDIVYAHSTNSASVYLGVAKRLGIKTIAHSHSAGFRGNHLEKMIKSFFARRVGQVSDYWFACSEAAALRLYGNKYKDYKNYFSIPNAIEANKYLYNIDIRKKTRAMLEVSDDVFLCGHVGTFSIPKNHIFLIDIFSEITRLRPNSMLICCGTGELLEEVKAYATSKGVIHKIIFAGVVKNINEYLIAMDTFIFPSLFEGFPISILEAEASGLPIVMSDVITKEVILSNLVSVCSLECSPKEWAKKVIDSSIQLVDRKTYNKIISESIYNINQSIKTLEHIFIQLLS